MYALIDNTDEIPVISPILHDGEENEWREATDDEVAVYNVFWTMVYDLEEGDPDLKWSQCVSLARGFIRTLNA